MMTTDDDDQRRGANGQFRKGFCPNPRGRPRKAPADLRQQMIAILHEEVTAGGQPMSMIEVLFRTYCKEALKNPRLLTRIFPLLMTVDATLGHSPEVNPEDDRATVEALLQAERDRVRRQTPRDEQGDGDGDE